MIRVLQDLSALDGGGVSKLLYDYYKNMDHTKVHFDFLIYNYYAEGIYEKELADMGCKIYKITTMQQDKKKCLAEMEQVVKDGNYDVVHSHYGCLGFHIMKYAKKYKVPKRIVHSHIAYEPISMKTRVANIVRAKIAKYYATDLFACGRDASIYQWGKHVTENGKVHIMKNAVSIEQFRFSKEMREEKRKELGIEDKFVLGVVGRLSEQKNYPFLFRVYKKVLEERKDVVLLVIGRGLEEEKIKKLSVDMGIADYILFLGVRNDVPVLLNAFDMFLLPSLYEGLPVVLIEAQANGVSELISDKITDEMNVTDLIRSLPIGEGAEEVWKNEIINYVPNLDNRCSYAEKISEAGYNIKEESKKMEEFYMLGK